MKKAKQEIKNRILSFTGKREADNKVTPSEVARDLFSGVWKEHLDEVRTMAGELQSEKLLKITRKGSDIRIDEARGPINLSMQKHGKKDNT